MNDCSHFHSICESSRKAWSPRLLRRYTYVAFLAIAVVLLNWPDTNLPNRYITGFRSLGMLESTEVLRQIPRTDPVPVKDLLARTPAAFAALNSCIPTGEAARFLLAKCHKDLSKGFAGPLMTEDEANSK